MTHPLLLAWSPFDPMHMLFLMLLALLLFGRRLPEVGRSLGRGISEFKKGLKDVKDEMDKDDHDQEPPRQNKLQSPRDERLPEERQPVERVREPQESFKTKDE